MVLGQRLGLPAGAPGWLSVPWGGFLLRSQHLDSRDFNWDFVGYFGGFGLTQVSGPLWLEGKV